MKENAFTVYIYFLVTIFIICFISELLLKIILVLRA